jgi:ABC-2 type transport system permease protein
MTGIGKLVRLILRRDRFLLPIWVLVFGLISSGYYASFKGLFPTDAERISYAKASNNAGFVALYGLLHGDSLAVLTQWRAGFLPVAVGLAALLTVIRHTRADEEAGRTELIGATALGRHAQLAAALLVTGAATLLIGLLTVATMAGPTGSVAGSLAYGAQFTVSGWVFAAVAAISAQLTSSARAARSIAVVVLGVAFTLRAGGDISALGDGRLAWLAWISPLGWVTHVFPYDDRNWWPVVLSVLLAVVAIGVAVDLRGRRDLGDGLFPARLGPASAATSLRTPWALAWRLHRGLLIGWTFGFALLGLVFGGVGSSVLDITTDNPDLADIFNRLGGSDQVIDSYFASTAGIVGVIAACYAVQAALRLRDEESTGRTEAILATSVSRLSWAAGHLVFSLIGPALALFAEGLVSGVVYRHGSAGDILAGAVVQLPAVWVMSGVAVLLFGLLPRWSLLAWAAPAISLLILVVGEALQVNQRLLDISPFTHIPHLPGDHLSATPLVSLVLVAALLGTAGLAGLRRRDIPD